MKKILFTIFFAATVILVYVFFIADDQESNHLTGPCDNPITYKIGNINAIYDVSELQLKEILEDAGDAWSLAIGKDLFTYSKKGNVSVNLIYGDQQRFMNKEQATVSRIRLEKLSYKTAEKKLLQLKTRYEEEKTAYEKLIVQYNRYVGDPSRSSTKESRIKQQRINQKRNEINRLGNTIHSKISALNRISERIDGMVADYNENFGSQRKFNQGNYKKNPQGEASTSTVTLIWKS